jgi:hypothetical protein
LDPLVSTIAASLDMSAQFRGPTTDHGSQSLTLLAT